MKLLKQLLVPIPDDKGIHVKSAGAKREKYVYKYVRYFRNSDGKPRNKAKSIGKLSSEPGMMVPNENYFEIYKSVTTAAFHQCVELWVCLAGQENQH